MSNVIAFPPENRVTIETDEGLLQLMQRTLSEVYDGDEKELEKAFAEALVQQIIELHAVNNGFSVDLAEELADAMRGVLLQWLGEHTCCPREDIPVFLARISQGRA